MHAAEQLRPWISEPLTWAEICARYPDEWVCLVEIDKEDPDGFEFQTARVVSHGKTRKAPIAQAKLWWKHYDTIAHYYTGTSDTPLMRIFV